MIRIVDFIINNTFLVCLIGVIVIIIIGRCINKTKNTIYYIIYFISIVTYIGLSCSLFLFLPFVTKKIEPFYYLNYNETYYISLTKKYTLEKMGLNSYQVQEALKLDGKELNVFLEKINYLKAIEKNSDCFSVEERNIFVHKILNANSFDSKEMHLLNYEIYSIINNKKLNRKKIKENNVLEKQKEILKKSLEIKKD